MHTLDQRATDARRTIVEMLCTNAAKARDDLIRQAISNEVGPCWTLKEVKDRLHIIDLAGKCELVQFDGNTILRIFRPEVHAEGRKQQVKIRYQIMNSREFATKMGATNATS